MPSSSSNSKIVYDDDESKRSDEICCYYFYHQITKRYNNNSQVRERERVQWGLPLQTHTISPIIYSDVNAASFSLNPTPHDSLVKLISQSQVLFY